MKRRLLFCLSTGAMLSLLVGCSATTGKSDGVEELNEVLAAQQEAEHREIMQTIEIARLEAQLREKQSQNADEAMDYWKTSTEKYLEELEALVLSVGEVKKSCPECEFEDCLEELDTKLLLGFMSAAVNLGNAAQHVDKQPKIPDEIKETCRKLAAQAIPMCNLVANEIEGRQGTK